MICAIWVQVVQAQWETPFKVVNSPNGLNPSVIYSVVQDSFGNIWAGTEEGVIRNNSRESYLYNKYSGLSPATRNRTYKVMLDSRHRIWACTEEGLYRYDVASNIFQLMKQSPGDTMILPRTMAEDTQNGRIWVGAFNGLWEFDPKKEQFRHYEPQKNVSALCIEGGKMLAGGEQGLFEVQLSDKKLRRVSNIDFAVTSITRIGSRYWIGTKENGLFKLEHEMSNPEFVKLPPPHQKNHPINKILVTKEGIIYVATDGSGLACLDAKGQYIRSFINDSNDPYSLSSNGLYDVIAGKESILWIATYGGGINSLNLAENRFRNITHILNNPNSLGHNFTRAILEDSEGNIWFGTKEGISVWYRAGNRWRHLQHLSGKTGEYEIVMALAEQGGHIWAGTYGQGAFKIDKKNFAVSQYHPTAPEGRRIALSKIYSILVDESGHVWMGGIDGDLHKLSSSGEVSTFSVGQVRHIIQSRDGSILVAGRLGVHRIIHERAILVEALASGRNGVYYSTISCVLEREDGGLILGTNGGGLLFYSPLDQSLEILDPQRGLPSDIVQSIVLENKNVFWAGTTRGLARVEFKGRDTILQIFDQSDGIISSEFNYGSFARFRDGYFAVGSTLGVIYFHPQHINRQNQTPIIALESFRVFHRKGKKKNSVLPGNINSVQEIRLRHHENSLSIKYAGVLHSNPAKVRYRWKMEGLDGSWSRPNIEDRINFTNLAPGKYVFVVQAANRDGLWGKERRLKIHITPPWWFTWQAYIVYALLLASAGYGIYFLTKMMVNKRNAEEQISFFSNITHELKTPLAILLSSLDHSIDGIQSSDTAKDKVKTTVERLNSLFDQLLNFNKVTSMERRNMQVSPIALEKHVEGVLAGFKPLLDEKGISVKSRFEWTPGVFYCDKEDLNKILFNLISNAIKYSQKGGRIELALLQKSADKLLISVSDDGIGIPKDQQKLILRRFYRGRNAVNSQSPGTGLGLMIIKSIAERYDGSIRFESEENEGSVFMVELKNQWKKYSHSEASPAVEPAQPAEFREKNRLAEYSDARILVVEDNDELRRLITDQIGTYFQTFEASNGREGLEMVGTVFPDIVLTDYIMPDMDGAQLVEALQNDINTCHIPIFMMTVLNSPEHKVESVESGVAAYFQKPIQFDYLLAKITSTLDWQKKMRARYVHETDVEHAGLHRNRRDNEFLQQLEDFVVERAKEETLSVHDLCRYVGMSRTALYMKLKNMVDMSPQNFIIHARLKYAKKLLRDEGLQIKEAAYLSGFSNPKYFSTAFKKEFGESPTSYVRGLSDEKEDTD
ncbi:MAG TPA: two-component regulator propeller domain-containing protein [Saprospiraceae bacterium]|nr:two-component regulator propeller domain-containing protein [Saprospiraceae bacterium]